jgi:hypothetical protein
MDAALLNRVRTVGPLTVRGCGYCGSALSLVVVVAVPDDVVAVAPTVVEVVLVGAASVVVVLESGELPQAAATSPPANNAAAKTYPLRVIHAAVLRVDDRRGPTHAVAGR